MSALTPLERRIVELEAELERRFGSDLPAHAAFRTPPFVEAWRELERLRRLQRWQQTDGR